MRRIALAATAALAACTSPTPPPEPGPLDTFFQPIGIEYEIRLEELRPRIDLFVFADRLEFRTRGKGGCGCSQEDLWREFDLAPIEVMALVTHPAQNPQHLNRVNIDHIKPSHRSRPHPPAVAGKAQYITNSQRARANHLRL